MKVQLLPSSFDENGAASPRQHLACLVFDDRVAFDAGSLAMAASARQREQIRDIVLTHAHLDHIAGLPLFIDDLFATLTEPVRVFARPESIEILERDVFNWSVYPRFLELRNANGPVMEYIPFYSGTAFDVQHLSVLPLDVNHKVPSSGFVISDGSSCIAMTGDTAELDSFWNQIDRDCNVSTILIECAFPDELSDLADISRHLTPSRLAREIEKAGRDDGKFYIVNIKPMYREKIIRQINEFRMPNLEILEIGHTYEF